MSGWNVQWTNRAGGGAIDLDVLKRKTWAGIKAHFVRIAAPVTYEFKLSSSLNYVALAHGLHAGVQLGLEIAKHRIARLAKPRDDFMLGVMVSGFDSLGPEYENRVRELFDFATVGW